MVSVDEMFHPELSDKRKLDSTRDHTKISKLFKISDNRGGRRLRVDAHAVDNNRYAIVNKFDSNDGESYSPASQAVAGKDFNEDKEGRFFGGGITAQQSDLLDYVDDADGNFNAAPEKIDVAWLRKTTLHLEKRISKNAELRAKFANDPARFIDSEADLDTGIKALSILAEHPELYLDFTRLGCAGSLVALLSHENTDIAINAIEIIGELIDEDVAAADEHWHVLVNALLKADLLGLLVSNLRRLDEREEVDRNGVYHALAIIENLCSRHDVADQVGQQKSLVEWLLLRARMPETHVSQNKQYSAEVLAILAQDSKANRSRLVEVDAVDCMVELVAPYRKRDPDKSGEEGEFMANLFEALTCLVDEPSGKIAFVDAEGVELCLIMLKEGKASKPGSLRLLDHAAGGHSAMAVCTRLIDAGGLKTLFNLFMRKDDKRILGHLIAVFSSILRHLPANSAERIRTLAKFVEKDYEKTKRLLCIRREYAARVVSVEEQARVETMGMTDDMRSTGHLLSRRLDAGLFTLQAIDVVLAWLIAEDDGLRGMIVSTLEQHGGTLAWVRATLEEQAAGVNLESDDDKDIGDILATLIDLIR